MKKLFISLFSVILFFLLLLFPSSAAVTEADFSYVLNVDRKSVTVTGISQELSPRDLTIPETIAGYPVTSISPGAFDRMDSLVTVTIPDTVTSIANRAFSDCPALQRVTLVAGLTRIDDRAFYNCPSLSAIALPEGLVFLGDSAFEGCSSLSSLTLPSTLVNIPVSAFEGCVSLTALNVPEGVLSIASHAFRGCTSLKEITIPNSVTTLGMAFANCLSVTRISLPFLGHDPQMSVGAHTLGYIFGAPASNHHTTYVPVSLKEVTLTAGTFLPQWAFLDCAYIETIHLPATLTKIDPLAFEGCNSLQNVTVEEGSAAYTAKDGCIIDNRTLTLVHGFSNAKIPSNGSVIRIAAYAFNKISTLTELTIPDTIVAIEKGAIKDCTGLRELTLPFVGAYPGDNDRHHSFGYLFGSEDSTNNYVPKSLKKVTLTGAFPMDDFAFYNCPSLVEISFTGAVESLGNGCQFGKCTSLTTLHLEKTVILDFDTSDVRGCTALTALYLPDTINRTIYPDPYGEPPIYTVYAKEGSMAHHYAIDNNLPFVALDNAPPVGGNTPEGDTPPEGGNTPEDNNPPEGGNTPEGDTPPEGGNTPEGDDPPADGNMSENEPKEDPSPLPYVLLGTLLGVVVALAVALPLFFLSKKRKAK